MRSIGFLEECTRESIMSQFKLGGVPSNAYGLFYALRDKVNGKDGEAWSEAMKVFLSRDDPAAAEAVLQTGVDEAVPNFPLYEMEVDGKLIFMPLQEAGITFDSGWVKVYRGGHVLEEGFVLRPMTDEEKREISRIADEYSASK